MAYKCIQKLPIYSEFAIVLHDGTFASCTYDKTIQIWKQNHDMIWEYAQTLIKSRFQITSLTVLPDGTFASGSLKEIKIWKHTNYGLWECVQTKKDYSNSYISHLTVLPDSTLVYTGDSPCYIPRETRSYYYPYTKDNYTITILKQNDDMKWKRYQTLFGHAKIIYSLTVLQDGTFASGDADGKINIWKQNHDMLWERVQTLIAQADCIKSLTVLHDGTFITNSKPIQIWKQNNDMKWECSQTLNLNYGWSQYLPDNTISIYYSHKQFNYSDYADDDDLSIKILKQNDDKIWECDKTFDNTSIEYSNYSSISNSSIILPDDTLLSDNKILSTPYSVKRIKSKIIFNNVIKNILMVKS